MKHENESDSSAGKFQPWEKNICCKTTFIYVNSDRLKVDKGPLHLPFIENLAMSRPVSAWGCVTSPAKNSVGKSDKISVSDSKFLSFCCHEVMK